jgi:hypothetical protein
MVDDPRLSRGNRLGGADMKKITVLAAGAAAILCLMTACGGSDGAAVNTTPPGGNAPPPAPPEIQGIATPSAVSVVTATNAG